MKVNLRKANRIQEELSTLINKVDISLTHQFDEHRDPDAVLTEKRSELSSSVDKKLALFDALYQIRKLTAKANAENGIDALLTDIAHIEKKITVLKPFEFVTKEANMEVIKSKIASAKEGRKDQLMYRLAQDAPETIPSINMLESYHAELKNAKRIKRQKQDELLALNVKSEIELSEEVVKLLETEGLV